MRRTLTAALAVLALTVAACGDEVRQSKEPPGVTALSAGVERTTTEVSSAELRAFTAAQLAFAVDLYRAVATDEPGDVVLGPGSLHTALAMIRAGARGQTATEMDAVLRADGRLHELGNALDRELRSRSSAEAVDVDIANRIWTADGLDLREDYVQTLVTSYGAALAQVYIAADPEGARAAVNAWVAAATREKIEQLFPEGSITADTRLVLANALHLEADWKFPFPAQSTARGQFRLTDGTSVGVAMMHYDEYLPSGTGPGWTAVRLPYDGEQLSMTVIVPDDLAAFEQDLDVDLLDEVEAGIEPGGIHLSLPRFTAHPPVAHRHARGPRHAVGVR